MSKRVKSEYDLVIVGSGIAGLSFALKVAEAGYRVAIFTKKDKAESNTNYAQGGIAAVTSVKDDLDKHVEDTLEAGDGLCDPEIVREILRDGPARIQDLAEMGVSFSSLDDGGSKAIGLSPCDGWPKLLNQATIPITQEMGLCPKTLGRC